MWSQFYEYYLNIAKNKKIPIYFFRYEDIVADPSKILREIFEFSLNVESLEGTYLKKRLDEVMAKNNRIFYNPRQGGINLNIHKFTDD